MPAVYLVGMKSTKGGRDFDPNLETIIVVSHEASATGAPILALSICREFSKNANVLTLLVKGGVLTGDFLDSSVGVIQPRVGIMLKESINAEIKRFCGRNKPAYALINSIVSAGAIQPIRSCSIPTLTLIHEFSAYIRPIEILNNVATWSNHIIFSSPLTRDDIIGKCPQLSSAKISVLPQGKCKRPTSLSRTKNVLNTKDDLAWQIYNQLDDDAILILGAGEVQARKGVDLFIAVCGQIHKCNPSKSIKFVWIGGGYEPLYDFNVSLWLEDQIKRSGLEAHLSIVNNSTAYENLMKRSNIFLMTSRLDPLPNVAIDAMHNAKPMLCFENACGVANLLKQDELLQSTLAVPYFDINTMASKASTLLNNPDLYQGVSERIKRRADSWFNMNTYTQSLREFGEEATRQEKLHENDLRFLTHYKNGDLAKSLSSDKGLSTSKSAKKYLLSWQNEIWPRKPIPGFHPGIYKEKVLATSPYCDPLVDYLKAGKPNGVWNTNLVTPESEISRDIHLNSVGVHIHVYYPELLAEILSSLSQNQLKADIYISYSNKYHEAAIRETIKIFNAKLCELALCPNRGRDIGPLLNKFGSYLDRNYFIHGHLHTKKSVLISKNDGDLWRNFLIKNLLGDNFTRMADRIVSRLVSEKEVGLVFPDDPTCVGWNGNLEQAKALMLKLKLENLPKHLNFPVGTMYWAKQNALSSLYDLDFSWSDYPTEPIGYDGSILHAIERLIPIVNTNSGYKSEVSYVPGLSR